MSISQIAVSTYRTVWYAFKQRNQTKPVVVDIQPAFQKTKKSCLMHLLISLVWFNGISTAVGYLMPNPFYTYILDIYDLVWLGFMAYQSLLVI